MGRTGGVEPEGKRSSGFGRLAWGAALVLSTILGVLAGPKILRDQHELMCGWSSGWQSFAGTFGDCGSYAEKSRTTVVINGPVVPQGPVPKKVLYDQNVNQFRLAFWDRDEKFLSHLHQTGFRLEGDEVCSQLDRVMREAKFDADSAGKATDVLARFADGEVRCEYGNTKVSGEAYLLKRGIRRNIEGCWSASTSENWTRTIAMIDRWVAAKGKSKDLAGEALNNLQLLKRAATVPRDDFVNACMTVFGTPSRWGAKHSDTERDAAMNLLMFGGSCMMKYRGVAGIALTDEVENRIDQNYQSSSLTREQEKKVAKDLAQGVCSDAISKTSFNIYPKPFEAALLRWSR